MKFKRAIREAVWVLLTEGRVSQRRLQHELGLDADQLDALCYELVEVKGWATAEGGDVLVWAGTEPSAARSLSAAAASQPRPTESASAEPLPGGERRQLTVMFCDLAGSTALATQLDPEDMQNLIAAYHDAVAPVIRRYDGFIAKYMGDGILIYFGYPQAQEKDTERAVLAGLAVIEAIPELNAGVAADMQTVLAVRIGIATGKVVVGESIGEGSAQERAVVGETPNLAARLQDLAPPNGIVISGATKELVGDGFAYLDLGLQELKGIDEPTVAWQVTGENDSEFESETGTAAEAPPLVGRQEELGLLIRAWQQSKEGAGQVVAISGEAGIGKSRLVEAISAEIRNEGYTRVTVRCSPYHSNSALYPVAAQLSRAMGWAAGDDAAAKLAKMDAVLAGYQFPSEETIPLIAALFALPLPAERYPPLTLSPAQQRLNTLDAVLAWLLEEAERQPMLTVWEDVHWADPSTLELLEMMIEQCPTVSALNALTYRPEFVPPWPARSHAVPLTLNRLERPEVEALIRLQAGGKALPPEVVAQIVERSDGVPLYVSELTRAILASGSLNETEDGYELNGPLSDLSIPASLQDSLMARLDKVPTLREVAQIGAVFGREFPYDMLNAVAAIEESALRDGLGQLVEAELLYQRGRPPRAKYMFKHTLIQDAAYQSLLKRTRQHYHQEVAALLANQFAETVETQPEILAHHYTEAGDNAQAIDYWLRSGQLALQRSAMHEAIGHLSKGLAMLPEGNQFASQELAMQRLRGTAFMATKGYGAPETAEAFDRARELCAIVKDDSIYPVLFGAWVSALTRANHADAFEIAVEMQGLVGRTSDAYAKLTAHLMSATSHLHMCNVLDARDHFDAGIGNLESIDSEDSIAKALLYGLDLTAVGYAYSAWCEWLLGCPETALKRRHMVVEALELARHNFSRSRAHYWCAVVNQLCGDWREVSDLADIAMEKAKEHGLAMVVAVGRILHGAADAALNGIGDQGPEIAEAIEAYTATGARFQSPYHRTLLADLLLRKGEIDSGLDVVNEAWHLAQETGEHYFSAEINRLKGELLLAGGHEKADAEACFLEALETARAQDAKSLELRAAGSLARHWRDSGKRTEARDLLTPIYAWFTEGFDTQDLKDAKALLNELS
jgi:predicted ATPase/class 3 adenylate cyclase